MKVSQTGLDLIKKFEGCPLIAYKDAVGVWTIGYGTTNADKAYTGVIISEGLTITKNIAENWLKLTVDKKYGPSVMKYDDKYHWNQNQFDALVSFAYNIGSIDQLTQNGTRTIEQISNKILAYNKAGGKVFEGLVRRRKEEKKLFDTPVKTKAQEKAQSTTSSIVLTEQVAKSTTKSTKALSVGATVKIKKGAVDVNTGKKYASFVYNKSYTVLYVTDKYVAFGVDGIATGKTLKKNCVVQ